MIRPKEGMDDFYKHLDLNGPLSASIGEPGLHRALLRKHPTRIPLLQPSTKRKRDSSARQRPAQYYNA